jgi:hypothetical protein
MIFSYLKHYIPVSLAFVKEKLNNLLVINLKALNDINNEALKRILEIYSPPQIIHC